MTTIAKTSVATTTTVRTPDLDADKKTTTTTAEKPVTCMGPADEFKATGPSGVVRHGENTYRVKNGEVWLDEQRIGTMDDKGNFDVRFSRQANDRVTGNIKDLIGATYEGSLSSGQRVTNQVTGSVQMGKENFLIDRGTVSEWGGKVIGTMDGEGRFRVQRDGKMIEGSIHELHGATFNGKDVNGKHVSNRPSGTVEVDGTTYEVKNGKVFQDGKDRGTLNDRGEYALVGDDGKQINGKLSDHKDVRFKGLSGDRREVQSHASGTVRIGVTSYQVDNGKVSLNGKQIGTLENDGSFKVQVNGQSYQGNVGQLHGAVLLGKRNDGSTVDTGPSGSVKVNGQDFDVRDGQVFRPRSRKSIGTINDRGEFDVRLSGKNVRGNITTTPGASWTVTG